MFQVNVSTMKLSGLNIFRQTRKNFEVKSRTRSRPRLQI